jgi:hypothetical protein
MRGARGIERRGESLRKIIGAAALARGSCARFMCAVHAPGRAANAAANHTRKKMRLTGRRIFNFSTRTHSLVRAFRSLNNLFQLA